MLPWSDRKPALASGPGIEDDWAKRKETSPVGAKAQQLNPDGYVRARDAGEYQRLRDQALMWQKATEAVLDRVSLKPGMSCLDVGSGPGSVMQLMADRVG